MINDFDKRLKTDLTQNLNLTKGLKAYFCIYK